MKGISLVSFYTNSFNRLALLKNLLRSFELCNTYSAVEWIITDYGSTDGSREFIKEYAKKADFKVKYIFEDEAEYFDSLKMKEVDRRTKFEAILRKYRNDAIAASSGSYLFDIATDHQFVRRGDWVSEIFQIFGDHERKVGRDSSSGVIAFGYFRWRLDKMNNERFEESNSDGVPYYVAKRKAYVDYSVMKKTTLNEVGKYFEVSEIMLDTPQMSMWMDRDDKIRPETEYSDRCDKLGLVRAFMKYPALVSLRNDEISVILEGKKDSDSGLFVPLWTLEEMKRKFGHLKRPVSSDELGAVMEKGLVARGMDLLKSWR